MRKIECAGAADLRARGLAVDAERRQGLFSMGWKPRSGFLVNRWDHYCELMMIDLLAIGSPTRPVAPEVWNDFTRTEMRFEGYEFISGEDPLFTHQYSQAWFDFRGKRDAYADYFTTR
jgi:hypothetical protein